MVPDDFDQPLPESILEEFEGASTESGTPGQRRMH
jgi:hypothetical protein